MCGHHRLISQCRLDNAKIIGQGATKHGSTIMRHEILHLSQWSKKHLEHHPRLSSPYCARNEEDGSP